MNQSNARASLRAEVAEPGLTRRRILLVDVPLAVVLGVTEFAIMQRTYVVEEYTLDPPPEVMWAPYLMMWAGSYAALSFRRIRPLLVFLVTSACLLIATLLQNLGPDELLPIAWLLSLFTLARRQRLVPSLVTLAGALTVSVLQTYLMLASPLRELSGRESYWVNTDPWYSHPEFIWITAAVYLGARAARTTDWLAISFLDSSSGAARPADREPGSQASPSSSASTGPSNDQ